MVSTGNESEAQGIIIHSQTNKKPHRSAWRTIVIVAIVLIAIAVTGYIGYLVYQANVDKRAETARINAEEKIQGVAANTELGGKFFVDYSVASARGDTDSARAAYTSDNKSDAGYALNCTRLFYAAAELNIESDMKYAGDCIEKHGTTYEDGYRIASMYKEKGDMDNARRFAAVAAANLNPNDESRQSNLDTLKEFGYEE